ncbi:MAG TPA: hypothetical protein VFQ44_14545 [Streptosporangiaceae bacterium]|nr:hypothetical protein [Streptosporangiaceae bacterium]
MTFLTPEPNDGARSAVTILAYEQGLRDAALIMADLELSSLPVTSGMPIRTTVAARPTAAIASRPRLAGSRRSATTRRRGQRIRARAARIAELRTDRTGSPHEVVTLPGGLYGVREVAKPKPSKPRRAPRPAPKTAACGS